MILHDSTGLFTPVIRNFLDPVRMFFVAFSLKNALPGSDLNMRVRHGSTASNLWWDS